LAKISTSTLVMTQRFHGLFIKLATKYASCQYLYLNICEKKSILGYQPPSN
jgi:hypothetical protein